jgi:5-bromo-4-chloroindolyl phosphate hydrolysis protein
VPQVGVIAQDLKRIFPDAVTKDDRGYYKIRRDEMFYSAINSVKELYEKISDLAKRVVTDVERIVILKKENKMLKDKLIMLSKELDNLEK